MAKLHNYHVLCPLIDQKSFLGVARDKEPEHVIITLGRNVVNKHRLSDQKQLCGWTSKDHITAPVIFDTEQNNYAGVFNNNTIKLWMDDNANLDKIKKYKFPINILKLIPRDDQPPLVIFTNGNSASLPYAIENRKTYESKSLLKDNDEIIEIAWYKMESTDFVCYILKSSAGYEIMYCPLRDELGDLQRSKLTRVKISRDGDVKVVGNFVSTMDNCLVFILWSDSKMFVYNLETKKWKPVGTVPWVSAASSVSMTWMGKNHLIIFGSNEDQDGAIIVAYNYILGVGSCRYPMKMYRENAKVYCYNGCIILEASNHIGMLPFTLEIKRNLSSLLASHEIIQNESLQVADWGTPTEPLFKCIPEMEESVRLGITERSACAQVIPTLLEKQDISTVMKVLQEFKDVPESALAVLVRYAVRTALTDNTGNEMVECELLNEIFKVLFCDALLIPHLRNNLTIDDTLNLIKYILYLLFESDMPLDADYESRLYDWCTLILDAFFQQYVISQDPKVPTTLDSMNNNLKILEKQLFTVSDTIAELHMLLSRKGSANDEIYLPYTIEMMEI